MRRNETTRESSMLQRVRRWRREVHKAADGIGGPRDAGGGENKKDADVIDAEFEVKE